MKNVLIWVAIIGGFLFVSSIPPSGFAIAILSFLILWYVQDHVTRITKLEKSMETILGEKKDEGYSWSFNIDVQRAVGENPIFKKLNAKMKNWKEVSKSRLHLTFLAKENAFFIQHNDGRYSFVFGQEDWHETDVYEETIIEEKNFGDSLSFCIRDRRINLDKTRVRVLTIYLLEKVGREKNYRILCDFPFTNLSIDKTNELGFEVVRSDGDVYEDKNKPFNHGGWSRWPDFTTWRKNGAEINYVTWSS